MKPPPYPAGLPAIKLPYTPGVASPTYQVSRQTVQGRYGKVQPFRKVALHIHKANDRLAPNCFDREAGLFEGSAKFAAISWKDKLRSGKELLNWTEADLVQFLEVRLLLATESSYQVGESFHPVIIVISKDLSRRRVGS